MFFNRILLATFCLLPSWAISLSTNNILLAQATQHYLAYNYKNAAHDYFSIVQTEQSCMPAWLGYGICCHNLGLFEQADNAFKRAFEHDANQGACSKLRLHALRTQRWQDACTYGLNPYWWYETDIQHKTVLITSEKAGIGDIVQFLRYLKRLHNAGAHVILEAPAYLHPMLSGCPFIVKLMLPHSNSSCDITLRVSTPELTLTMCNTLQNPCIDVPYIYADPQRLAYWHNKLAPDTHFKIGLCWHPSTMINTQTGKEVANPRSIPLSCFSSLCDLTSCSFYSLQVGSGSEQVTTCAFPIHVFDEKTFDRSYGAFNDTLAVMKQLDLIITADTSIAHIAGALGVPVWVILPACSDFRWFLDTDRSPWYPTMRLFRQTTYGDWGTVLKEVYAQLAKIVE